MAFERIGIGGVLTIDETKYVGGIKRASKETTQFIGKVNTGPASVNRFGNAMTMMASKVKMAAAGMASGMNKMMGGIQNLAFAAMPLSIGLGFAFKQAVDFEKQMSNVGAVTLAGAQDMKALNEEAERLGIVSTFSATQAAEAQEQLGRAGAEAHQIIAALPGVTAAAAADDMELARASEVVAGAVKGMGLEWDQASRVANVLAQASAKTMTDIDGLGEAMKMAMPTASQLGMELEDTVATLGIMADGMLKGTMGGTSFTNMMNKLSRPTSKATALMEKYNVKLTHMKNGVEKLRSPAAIAEEFAAKIEEAGNPMDKMAVSAELMGLRGMKAFNALSRAGAKGYGELKGLLDNSTKAFGGVGVAAEMSRRRLDNVWGALNLLSSSLESVSINLFKGLLGPMKETFQEVTAGLNSFLFMMKALDDQTAENTKSSKWYKSAVELVGESGAETALQVAKGVQDAIAMMKQAWTDLTENVKKFGIFVNDSVDTQKFMKWVTIIGIAVGAVGPLLMSFIVLKFLISGVIGLVTGAATFLAAAFWPVVAVLAVIGIAFSFLRKENESFGETASRVFGSVKTWILGVYNDAVLPFIDGIKSFWIPMIDDLGETWGSLVSEVKVLFADLFESFSSTGDSMAVNWKTVGQVLMAVFSAVVKVWTFGAKLIVNAFKLITFPVRMVLQLVENLAKTFAEFAYGSGKDSPTVFIRRLGLSIIDFLISPIRILIKGIIDLASILGAADLVPAGLKTFAEKGFTGLVFPEKDAGVKVKPPAAVGAGAAAAASSLDAEKKAKTIELSDGAAKKMADAVKAGTKDKKTQVDLKANLCVDGEAMSVATARHKTEVKERSGEKFKPWQKVAMLDRGVV